jgi:Rad3-related DNA helicase
MGILDYKPNGVTLRPVQEDVLLWVEKNWNAYNLLVIEAPTALGKSIISLTIARWEESKERSVALLTPSNILINQYVNEFTDIPFLKGSEHYMCDSHPNMTCAEVEETYAKKCKDCHFRKAKRDCIKAPISIYNYHSYYMLKEEGKPVRKDTLLVDESHSLWSFLQELSSMRFWSHKIDTSNVYNIETFVTVLQEHYREASIKLNNFHGTKKDKAKWINKRDRLSRVIDDISHNPSNFSYARGMELYKNKPMEAISVKPLTMDSSVPKLWNGKTDRIVMLSGTINERELKAVGINNLKVCHYKAPSPIPVDRRMVYISPVSNMSYHQVDEGIEDMVKAIKTISDLYPNDKGVIHCTYSLGARIASMLRLNHTADSRFIVYDKKSKAEVLNDFISSDQPKVLIASGVSEGVDLKENLCRFQILAKIVFPSSSDPHMKNLSVRDSEMYKWLTIKNVVQSCGRSTRTPTDFSEIYILDSTFVNFYGFNKNLFPNYFRDSVKYKPVI